MINKIKQLENMLKTSYPDILNFPRFIKQSSGDLWGKTIIRLARNDKGELYEVRDEIESWYCTVTITDTTKLEDIVAECRQYCKEKDTNGFTSWEEGWPYTCHQLCDWQWLEGEDGKIIREVKTLHGVEYQATLVKYAKILKDLEV